MTVLVNTSGAEYPYPSNVNYEYQDDFIAKPDVDQRKAAFKQLLEGRIKQCEYLAAVTVAPVTNDQACF